MTPLKVGIRIVCKNVDLCGFTGRELHPSKADVGVQGLIMKVEDLTNEDPEARDWSMERGEDPSLFCYTVATFDGRFLEFMGFEVAAV